MASRRRIGDDAIERSDEDGYTLRVSGEYDVIGDHWMPTWVELEIDGRGGPDSFVRLEVRDGAPQVVRLEWVSQPGQTEIRPRDLRDVEFDALLMLFSGFTLIADRRHKKVLIPGPDTSTGQLNAAYYAASKFVEHQRRPEGHRVINTELLKAVAEVYRLNIDRAPTQAVAKAFGVKSRMASTYVDRARQAGYLPRTKQGQKKA